VGGFLGGLTPADLAEGEEVLFDRPYIVETSTKPIPPFVDCWKVSHRERSGIPGTCLLQETRYLHLASFIVLLPDRRSNANRNAGRKGHRRARTPRRIVLAEEFQR